MARDLGPVPTQTPTSTTPAVGGGRDFGSISLDQGMAGLAHSQSTLDRYNTETAQAKAVSDKANSPLGLAQETTKQTVNNIFGGPVKAIRSGVQAVGELFGAKPNYNQTYTDFAGNTQKTLQGDVYAGDKSVAGAATEFGAEAASLLPIGKAASLGEKLIAKPVSKLTSYVAERAAKKAEEKAVTATIDAVDPALSGKKAVAAYKQVVTGQRGSVAPSVFHEQGLTPNQQTVNLGTRLKDLGLNAKDHVGNLDKLANGLTDTETKLQAALKGGDPEVKYLADKQTLLGKLNEVKTNAPEEFRIKDSQAMVDRVTNFANKIVAKADDSIGGVRDARTAFDTQAKREFPNAFKPDGTVDTKTPAGYAIKTARDTINEHLYHTAPNGSEIQSLIGHEADIYKAAQTIAEKAAKGNGSNAFAQWAKANPKKWELIKYGTAGVGGAEAVNIGKGLLSE